MARRLVALVLAACAMSAAASSSASAATAGEEMARCAAFGEKHPGSAADAAAAQWIEGRFRGAGLETSVEQFHLPAYVVHDVAIAVVGQGARPVPGETFAYGGTGTVEADVVDVGTGRSSDYAGKDAKGKIVMVDRNEAFHRTSQLNEVLAHGGVAMLYVSGSPNNLIQTGTVRFAQATPAPIPTVTVGADEGKALRSQLGGGGLRMRIRVDATREDAVGRNVIGVRRGTTYPDRIVVVGGHYDSWHGGAVDNCSGIGSMLSIIDATKTLNPAYTIVFGAWDAEEIGLVGSYDWVMRHQDLVPNVVVDENLEMTSAATYVGQSRLDYSAINLLFGTTSPALNAVAYEAAARNAFAPAPTTAAGVRSISGGIIPTDLQPFYAQGVQGFSTFSSTPYYHTVKDDADKIDPASHERVSAVLRDALVDLQNVPPDALAYREVPRVVVSAPPAAAPGAPVDVSVTVTDPAGRPVQGVPVKILVNQRDHWVAAEGFATETAPGRYAYTIPAGATEADRTAITATADQPTYIAQGFGFVDQRAGGVLAPASGGGGRECLSRRRIVAHARRSVHRVRARVSAGRVRVRGHRIVVDLRGVRRGAVRLRIRARDAHGRVVRERRTYHPCVRRPRVGAAVRYAFAPGRSSTRVTRLRVTGMPAGAALRVRCRGAGCPFSRRRWARTPTGSRDVLRAFGHRTRLRAGTVITLRITAPGRAPQMVRFTLRRGRQPKVWSSGARGLGS